MPRSIRTALSRSVLGLAALVVLSGAAPRADRPHSSSGTAQFTSPTTFIGEGHATHLGRYTEAGTVTFTPGGKPGVLTVEGTLTYTAANGDDLTASVIGELNGLTGAITATVTYTGGTGRFDDASGSADLQGQVQPDGTLAVKVEGAIDY